MSTVRRSIAAVIRDGEQHVFNAAPFTGDNHSVISYSYGDDLFEGKESIVQVDGDMIRTVENTPLAATLVWDNSQINLYYLAQTTSGASVREICQRGDDGWSNGSLSEFLIQEGVFAAPDSGLTVWKNNEDIYVYFKSTDDGERELTLAKYFAEDSQWNLKKLKIRI